MAAFMQQAKVTVVQQYMMRCRSATQSCARMLHTSMLNAQTEAGKEAKAADSVDTEEFRVYHIEGLERVEQKKKLRRRFRQPQPPRFRSMAADQDWTNVWPAASTFKWSVVPFPVRQGFVESSSENKGVVPSKYANLELMKPPNFLHLTPAHVKKHCEVLKKFCTPWPEGLETDARCRHHFPVETVTCDYVFAAPSIRDSRARFATIKFHLSDLGLDYHARDKFIRLVGERYNKETDEVILESGRCPLKSQNMEYLKFVLTAAYFESWKQEPWEKLKELSDMERYFWDMNTSRETCVSILKKIKAVDDTSDSKKGRLSYLPADISDEEAVCSLPEIQKYKVAVEEIWNEGENIETLNNYKDAVKTLLNIQSDIS